MPTVIFFVKMKNKSLLNISVFGIFYIFFHFAITEKHFLPSHFVISGPHTYFVLLKKIFGCFFCFSFFFF